MAISDEEKFRQMLEEPVNRLIPKLAFPSMVSMIVVAVYNMADTFFVSRLGTSASAAVGVVFSMAAIIQAIAFMIGMGCGNEISRLLGAKKQKEAERYVAVGFFTELIIGTMIAIIAGIFVEPLVYALGSTKTIAPYAMQYARIILFGSPFMMASLGMNNMLRFQGNSFYSMIGISTGGVLNMFLDPLFIYVGKMGIGGAAVATVISQMISFGILLYQCNRMPACISVSPRNFKPSIKRYSIILRFGCPSLARQGIAGVSTILLNFSAHPYGDAAIAAMAIVMRVSMFIFSLVIGFGQGGFSTGLRLCLWSQALQACGGGLPFQFEGLLYYADFCRSRSLPYGKAHRHCLPKRRCGGYSNRHNGVAAAMPDHAPGCPDYHGQYVFPDHRLSPSGQYRGTATAGHLPDSDFADFSPCLRAFRPANVSAPQ